MGLSAPKSVRSREENFRHFAKSAIDPLTSLKKTGTGPVFITSRDLLNLFRENWTSPRSPPPQFLIVSSAKDFPL